MSRENNQETVVARVKRFMKLGRAMTIWRYAFLFGFLHIANVAAVAAMIGLIVVGFLNLGKAVWCSLGLAAHDGSDPLYLAVKGVEYFFLSPLPLLVLEGLLRYVTALAHRMMNEGESGETEEQTEDEAIEVAKHVDENELHAREQLLTAKSFTVSLLAAAVATALVGEVISKHTIDIMVAGGGCIVLLSLVGLLLAIQREEEACRRDLRELSQLHEPAKKS